MAVITLQPTDSFENWRQAINTNFQFFEDELNALLLTAAGPQGPPVPAYLGQHPGVGGPVASAPGHTGGIFHTLVPIRSWLTDPALRQWPRLLVAAYALVPVILLVLLQNTTDLVTLGWVYCLYIAPLWALVFWWLIRPGPIGWLQLGFAFAGRPVRVAGARRGAGRNQRHNHQQCAAQPHPHQQPHPHPV